MKKILVTGFEPFNGMDMNSSSMVLNKIKCENRNAVIVKMLLPVLYEKAFDMLRQRADEMKPDCIICMGQAGGRKKIIIERIAVNINSSAAADNDGIIKTDELIAPKGPDAFFTSLPYERMLSAGGQDVSLSYSAGTYICNDILYRLMKYIKSEDLNMTGGFLHLPFTEHFGKMPYIELKNQIKAVENMIDVIGE